jgi:membrane protein DedA with SNARE-associated domain
MSSYFGSLIDLVHAYPKLAFGTVFLLALSEAIPVVGTVVPGSTLILAISALATPADITIWPLLLAALFGAIAGDGFAFWLGHRYHRQILRGWPINRFPQLIDRSANFVRRYGVASVFLARFTAVVRAFVPLLAGVLRMSARPFYVANVVSALVWAPCHVFPGALIGWVISLAGAEVGQFVILALFLLCLGSVAWHLLRGPTPEPARPTETDIEKALPVFLDRRLTRSGGGDDPQQDAKNHGDHRLAMAGRNALVAPGARLGSCPRPRQRFR